MSKILIEISDIENMVSKTLDTVLNEGTSLGSYNFNKDNGSINVNINTSTKDNDNSQADTRIFGTKNDIINGDETKGGKRMSLGGRSMMRARKNSLLSSLMGLIDKNKDISDDTIEIVKKYFDKRSNLPELIKKYNKTNHSNAKELKDYIEASIEKFQVQQDLDTNKIKRVSDASNVKSNGKFFRYDTGKVPGTNIDFVSLFSFNDFNFSDMIKNGNFRQNDVTDKILGINGKDDREKIYPIIGSPSFKKYDATYDNGIKADLLNNFSLDNKSMDNGSGHFKKQFGYNDENYTSVTKFMDKSIIYANAVLNEIGFIPSAIVSTPSSSKYNEYYCLNLSRKLGVPYMKDFFERNVIGMDKASRSQMEEDGVSSEDIDKFEKAVTNGILTDIYLKVLEPIQAFLDYNKELFSSFVESTRYVNEEKENEYRTKGSLNKKTIEKLRASGWIPDSERQKENVYFKYDDVCKVFKKMVLRAIVNIYNKKKPSLIINKIMSIGLMELGSDFLSNYEIERVLEKLFKDYNDDDRVKKVKGNITKSINYQIFKKEFLPAIEKAVAIAAFYSNKITSTGIDVKTTSLYKFKITNIDKRFRKYLTNMYIVAKEYLNKYGEILDRFKNANILIFDEDMNSGASLKLCIDAIKEKLPNKSDAQIKCLVNGFSNRG